MRHHDDVEPDDDFEELAAQYEELAARERSDARMTSPRSMMVD